MTTQAEKARQFPRAAPRRRAAADAEPVGRRIGAHARVARLRGAGHDERRARDDARPARRSGHARRSASRTRRRSSAATDVPVSADLENGFADDPDGVAATIGARDRRRARRLLGRGLLGQRAVRRRARARRGSRPRPKPRTAATCTSCSPRAPRTTSAATPISTTRSPGSSRTKRPAPTCCTRPGSPTLDDIRRVVVVGRPPGERARAAERADASPSSRASGVKRISVGGAFAYVALGALADAGARAARAGNLRLLGDRRRRARASRAAAFTQLRSSPRRNADHVGERGAVLREERVAALVEAQLRAGNACGDRLAVARRRDAVEATARDERRARDRGRAGRYTSCRLRAPSCSASPRSCSARLRAGAARGHHLGEPAVARRASRATRA